MLPKNQRKSGKGKNKAIWLVVILVAIIVIAWYFLMNDENENSQTGADTEADEAGQLTAETENVSNWQTYHSQEYGFKIKHPSDMRVESRRMGDGPGVPTGISFTDSESGSEIGVIVIEDKESVSCYLGLCMTEAKSDVSVNGTLWSDLGNPSYAADFPTDVYSLHFRTAMDNVRYYALFSGESEGMSIFSTFEFIK